MQLSVSWPPLDFVGFARWWIMFAKALHEMAEFEDLHAADGDGYRNSEQFADISRSIIEHYVYP